MGVLRVAAAASLGVLTAVAGVDVGGRVAEQWSYAAERGRIEATASELAGVEQVSNVFRMVARVAKPAVVHIEVAGGLFSDEEIESELEEFRERNGNIPDDAFRDWLRRRGEAAGSGVVIDERGYIVTNNHVVGGRELVTVTLWDDRQYPATVVGVDPKSDLAVIRIDAPDLQPLRFGDSDQVEVGDWVLAVGAPFGLSQTVTHGIVSAKGRTRVAGINITYQDFIQTDAAVNPGNSGGPLLNLRGEIVGINTAIATQQDRYNAGVAFAIPADMAERVVTQLIENGEVQRGWLGISMADLSEGIADAFGLRDEKGVVVDGVLDDTPADRAGLQVEDVITSIDDVPVDGLEAFRNRIADIGPGETIRLRVMRHGNERRVSVTLGRQPSRMPRGPRLPGIPIEHTGLKVRSMPYAPLMGGPRGEIEDLRGVVVVETDDRVLRGIEPGYVISEVEGRRVDHASDFQQIMNRLRDRDEFEIRVIDVGGDSFTVNVSRP